MTILELVEYLCRMGEFSTTSVPTKTQVEADIDRIAEMLIDEFTRRGLDYSDYENEFDELVAYRVAMNVLIPSVRDEATDRGVANAYKNVYELKLKEIFAKANFSCTQAEEESEVDWLDNDTD